MYFSEAPKTSKKDMFNYSQEYHKLFSALSRGRVLIQIKGKEKSRQNLSPPIRSRRTEAAISRTRWKVLLFVGASAT
ncbi:MAG TPA: hypothetical protein VJN71_07335 [Nitrososphaerales archaeon]|nr:hypothetical protein [Nitrososphaerales archaeon]